MAFKIGSDTVIKDNTEIIGRRVNHQYDSGRYEYQSIGLGYIVKFRMNINEGTHFVFDVDNLPDTDDFGTLRSSLSGSLQGVLFDLYTDTGLIARRGQDSWEITVLWKNFQDDYIDPYGTLSTGSYIAFQSPSATDGNRIPSESSLNITKFRDVIFKIMQRPSADAAGGDSFLAFISMKDMF